MFKIGDEVRFVTTEPEYEARWHEGILTVSFIYDDGDLEVNYPDCGPEYIQCVSPNDVELANA